ncbi:PfaD family polyunsaturated fatty acid/polyketide biosynthesis protein [Pelobacter sp. M08fum]|uniref:PfaD family polyunsaturated fatty acid/polyketide biosynthesis protein n=2 Tax=Pelovirga terrestris TaxID=2771352 RepID=A0A8J6QWJ9_9BACT|nr:PfaD family polyunsaturated fatty acid/polyketide biosynthesis protein [Pelovirga terrestris]MBD1399132.1 PfaD family polyunsaturated fatty acid/polyketide biosynthesis protein [Pelovirga terrestris]
MPLWLIKSDGLVHLVADQVPRTKAEDSFGMVPACLLDSLGSRSFCHDHGVQYAYVGGSMAKGISSVAMVKALGEAGMLGFFGSAGLSFDQVEAAIDELQQHRPDIPFGVNLIHSPTEPELEKALVELYLRRGIHLIEASAFLGLTLPLVRYRTHGIHRDEHGCVVAPNRIIAKVSREEVAARFFEPPAEKLLQQLVAAGDLTKEQAHLAGHIPMAQDVTAEADSGGHTDNRPALSLFPTLLAQKDQMQQHYDYPQPLRIGLGGGIATPASAAAAFAMGADYLVTGTVNQACVESGTCDAVRQMLAETRQADITMAPSGDMFEMGVKVQVVKRGTMFAIRAHKLYELYRAYESIDALPTAEREKIEKTFFKVPLDTVWQQTQSYFQVRDPRQVEKALNDPKYKMALVFRWYLGQTPVWANQGIADRKIDYQIWCGPAMGAFNEWVKGSFLEPPAARKVVPVAYNILFGAAVLQRVRLLKQQWGTYRVDPKIATPLPLEQIKEFLC